MNLPEISINRPVLAFMLSALLVLFGIISFDRIGSDRYPKIEFPIISITTTLTGANPEIIDASITSVMESGINSVPGIEHILSTSTPGASVVRITFDINKDIDVAFNEVQSKVNQVLRDLPAEADPPVVAKLVFGAIPVMWLTLEGDRTLQQLNQYARIVIKKQLENISGVGEVRVAGRRDRTIRVNLNVETMNAYGVTTQDLLQAFANEHFQMPGGFLVGGSSENLIKLDLEYHTPADLETLIVSYRNGAPIRLADIAVIEDGMEDDRRLARYNDNPAVGLGIVKVSGSNAVAIIQEVERRLAEDIIPQLPPGMRLNIASNDADLIEELVAALEEHLVLGAFLTALVVWLFLRSLRATAIIAVSIPVSLMGAIALMYFAGFSFDTMTMLALLLLIGIVVDDAIVVLENIYRHREEIDPDPKSAALHGANQVVFAVMAATLTLVSIFVPVIFMEGIMGQFFSSFAVVVTAGVLISLFVSLTLTPMLCSRYLKVTPQHGAMYKYLENGFLRVEQIYRYLLRNALQFRWMVVALTIVSVLPIGYFFGHIGKGFFPQEDESTFLIGFKTPLGASLDYTNGRLTEIEKVLKRHKEVTGYFSTIGTGETGQVTQGSIFVTLAPPEDRDAHLQELLVLLRADLAKIPGVKAFPTPVSGAGGQRGEPLQFVVMGPDIEGVAFQSQRLLDRLAMIPELGQVDLDLQLELPQLTLDIDRTRAADMGLSTRDISLAVNVLAGGLDVAKYNDLPGDGERYDVRLKAEEKSFRTLDDLHRIYLRGRGGNLVRLDTVVSLEEKIGPAAVTRFDLRYSGNFFSSPTVPLGDGVELVHKAAEGLLPPGYSIQMVGQADEFGRTASYMATAFGIAIILVYMVLASQFDSFVQPFVLMIAQPLAMIGGVFGLWLFNMSLNIYSIIGLVLLMGLVAKNSILLIDLANQLRAEGKGINDSLLEACPIRLRPVLMTSMTIIIVMLPAALGLGAGADTNGPMAVAVIGGMVSSTLLTLVVIPAVYSLVEHGMQSMRDWRQKRLATP